MAKNLIPQEYKSQYQTLPYLSYSFDTCFLYGEINHFYYAVKIIS